MSPFQIFEKFFVLVYFKWDQTRRWCDVVVELDEGHRVEVLIGWLAAWTLAFALVAKTINASMWPPRIYVLCWCYSRITAVCMLIDNRPFFGKLLKIANPTVKKNGNHLPF